MNFMKKNRFILACGVILAVLLVFAGLGCQKTTTMFKQPEPETATSTPTSTPTSNETSTPAATVTAVPKPTPTAIADSETYTNGKYGYSFFYSKVGWHLSDYNEDDVVAIVNFKEGDGRELMGDEAKIDISVFPNTENVSLKNYIDSLFNDEADGTLSKDEATVAGLPAYKIVAEGFGIATSYYLLKDGNFFVISLYSPSQDKSHVDEFEGVVESFRFM